MRARSMQMMNNVVEASQERHGMLSLTKEAFMLRLGWTNCKMENRPRKSDDRFVPMRRRKHPPCIRDALHHQNQAARRSNHAKTKLYHSH